MQFTWERMSMTGAEAKGIGQTQASGSLGKKWEWLEEYGIVYFVA